MNENNKKALKKPFIYLFFLNQKWTLNLIQNGKFTLLYIDFWSINYHFQFETILSQKLDWNYTLNYTVGIPIQD